MTREEFVSKLNQWGKEGEPFLFVVDFEFSKPLAWRLSDVDPAKVLYNINGFANGPAKSSSLIPTINLSENFSFDTYRKKFNIVHKRLQYGDSYLANLTARVPVQLSHPMKEVFIAAKARYKLLIDESFVVFSPESFIRIEEGVISSYPMKGTIDASILGAEQVILQDEKEMAEHVTIVDLIRNDLSRISSNVQVTRFRFIDRIVTDRNTLLQVSSEIKGILPLDYWSSIGTLLAELLPAGSVTGAPKEMTVQIIKEAEGMMRGYYTGVFGYFDGKRFDSGVMIRFIEKEGENYFYRSGGGITAQSTPEREYQEIIDKIYVPVA